MLYELQCPVVSFLQSDVISCREMCNRIEDGETMLKWWKDEDDKTMLECKDKDGMTPLLTATASGSVGAVNSFIVKPGDDQPDGDDEQFEANVSAADSRECNVIHLAVENGDVNVLKVRWAMFVIVYICKFAHANYAVQ